MAVDEFVWVIETHEGYGEDAGVLGVYVSEQAARAALEKRPNMEVCTEKRQDGRTSLKGYPVDEDAYPHTWATVTKHRLGR